MSVKFEDEASRSLRKDTKELAHKVGERLTGGKSEAGYLAVCLPIMIPNLAARRGPCR